MHICLKRAVAISQNILLHPVGVDPWGTHYCGCAGILQLLKTQLKIHPRPQYFPPLCSPCSCTRVCKTIFKISCHTHNKGFSGPFVPFPPFLLPSSRENKSCSAASAVHLPISQLQKRLCLQLSWAPHLFHNSKWNLPLSTLEVQTHCGWRLRISCP